MRKTKVKTAVESATPALSSQKVTQKDIDNAINNKELLDGIDKWLKSNEGKNTIKSRDFSLLGSIVAEYLDSFVLLGYNLEGERVMIRYFPTVKDSDAVMEFLKNVFFESE